MHQSAIDAFPDFSVMFEGRVSSMYCDVRGLITTAVGCLIDPVRTAIVLPWHHEKTGARATLDEIGAAWRALKAQSERYAKLHYKYAAQLNDLRLSDEAIDDLVRTRLQANEKILRFHFPNWDLFPADAQLACSSMAWALGAGFPQAFGNFTAAANRQDWTGALAACKIREDNNPGLVPRNAANRLCFGNAAAVVAQGLPLDVLHWPDTTPSASQRDQALRAEASLAVADLTNKILRHGPYGAEDDRPTPPDPPKANS